MFRRGSTGIKAKNREWDGIDKPKMPKMQAIQRIGGLMKKLVYSIQGREEKLNSENRLEYWKVKFSEAYAQFDPDEFDDFENVYRGTHETTKNVNSTSNQAVKKTNNVPNITFEIIETQVNNQTPNASIVSMKPGFSTQAKMIQEKINSDLTQMATKKMSDINERNTYIHGMDPVSMNWNRTLGTHEYVGEKEFVHYHPKQFIGQPGVYEVEEMDYYFLAGSTTKQSILREYGIDVTEESEEYPDLRRIEDEKGDSVATNEIVTEIVCYYKDDDGDRGKFVWAGSKPLEDLPKYFYPRVMQCKDCGYESPQGTKECPECGSKKLIKKIETYETVQEDIILSPIRYKTKQYVLTDAGQAVPLEKEVVIERQLKAGDKIRIPAPKFYPISIRINTPVNFQLRGRSDVETIRDQQETIKKTWSRVEEKIDLAPAIITIPEGLKKQVTNTVYDVYRGKPQDLQGVEIKDLQANISQDVNFALNNIDLAKNIAGITPSYQGQYDSSAKSGRAKEVQVQQTAGRLQSKVENRFDFWAKLFKIMFYFDILFTSEERPYAAKDIYGDLQYKNYNKYELLMRDAAGNWYYNTDFIFKADMGGDIPNNKAFLYDHMTMAAQSGMVTPPQYWEVLAKLGFPEADNILEQMKQQTPEQGQPGQLPPQLPLQPGQTAGLLGREGIV
jgi:hypothetical protein